MTTFVVKIGIGGLEASRSTLFISQCKIRSSVIALDSSGKSTVAQGECTCAHSMWSRMFANHPRQEEYRHPTRNRARYFQKFDNRLQVLLIGLRNFTFSILVTNIGNRETGKGAVSSWRIVKIQALHCPRNVKASNLIQIKMAL
jgi:hypothetical protein